MKTLLQFLILLLPSVNSHAQKSQFKPRFSAVLDTMQGQYILLQCSRTGPGKINQYWQISNADVKTLEGNFRKIDQLTGADCCIVGARVGNLEKFGFQYLGVVIKGRKYIYINAFPIEEVQEYRDSGHDPAREPVSVCDGGADYWGALFDVESKQFSALSFNGVG